jgi:uncharacterized protein (DUF1684 family)
MFFARAHRTAAASPPWRNSGEVRIILLMNRRGGFGTIICLLLSVGFQSCSQRQPPVDEGSSRLLLSRKERDRAFQSDPQSPVPVADRGTFAGLDYYPPDPNLRFRVRLNRYPRPESIRMTTNTGEVRSGLRYGFFEFPRGATTCRLQVYRIEDEAASGKASLFVPFLDATTGKETYQGGRYMDLPENASGSYDLDFNLAYNPYCAYGGDFSCPVPPEENRLSVAIRAGEKKYPLSRK